MKYQICVIFSTALWEILRYFKYDKYPEVFILFFINFGFDYGKAELKELS